MIEMSRPRTRKLYFPLFAIALLLMSIVAPALATSPAKAQASPLPAAKNVVNATISPPGQAKKIGNISTPPAIVRNLSGQVKDRINEALLKQTKRLAEVRINILVNQLELYEKRITYSSLGADQKSAIIAVADENIAWLRQIDSDVQAADDLDAIRALMAQVDQQADVLKANIKKDAGVMACDGLDARIATARNVSATIAGRLAALKAQGKDTSQPEGKLADYDEHLDAAGQCSAAARAAFLGITGAADADRGFAEGYRQIGLADREMSRAYADLKDVYLWYLRNTARQ